MDWYVILLIVVGVIFVFFILTFLLHKLTKPRFKNANKYLNSQPTVPQVKEIKQEEQKVSPVGLNLDGMFGDDERLYYEQDENKSDLDDFDFNNFSFKREKKEKKSLAEQIRELSPELKILLFDRGLARKEFEFKSKKDWTCIPF